MNVKELIAELLECDMNATVEIKVDFNNDEYESNDVEIKQDTYYSNSVSITSGDMNTALIDSDELEELKNKIESLEEEVKDLKEENEKLEEELEAAEDGIS